MTKQERQYIIALMVVAFLGLLLIGEMLVVMRYLTNADAPHFPLAWELLILVSCLNLLVIVLILLTFFYWRSRGRLFLTALNIILLFNFPFGTVLGVYYLWKIDRKAGGESHALENRTE